MSNKTLPILFLNLGGEMLYILDQRLRAQSIPQEKSRKGKDFEIKLLHGDKVVCVVLPYICRCTKLSHL